MNNNLKLLITENYPKYYKSEINPIDLSIVNRWDYKNITLIGDESMFNNIAKLINLIRSIKTISKIEYGSFPRVFVETSYCLCIVVDILKTKYSQFKADGITLTINEEEKINHFIYTNEFILSYKNRYKNVSLNLKIIPEMISLLPKNIDLSSWKINSEGTTVKEDFKKITNLW